MTSLTSVGASTRSIPACGLGLTASVRSISIVEYEEGAPHAFVLNASADDGRQVSEKLETDDFVSFRWKNFSGGLDACSKAALVSMRDELVRGETFLPDS